MGHALIAAEELGELSPTLCRSASCSLGRAGSILGRRCQVACEVRAEGEGTLARRGPVSFGSSDVAEGQGKESGASRARGPG